MCDCGGGAKVRLGRRAVLLGGPLALAGATAVAASPAQVPSIDVGGGLRINPRSAWAAGLPAPEGLPVEGAGDVRVLLVHHSASGNDYAASQVASVIRSFHAMHTSPEKGWPDVAYNFFVDRFGTVWEGRTGSIDRPVIGSATGGNQGFSQLVCLIGDFQVDAPSPEALSSLTKVLAWMAMRYGVDPSPGTKAQFVSRGSNRWPAGANVSTTTIAGHRDMSSTVCPGDAAYRSVADGSLAAAVLMETQRRAAQTAPPTSSAPPPTTVATTEPSTQAPPTTEPGTDQTGARSSTTSNGAPSGAVVAGATAGTVGLVALGALALRRRRDHRPSRDASTSLPVNAFEAGRWEVSVPLESDRLLVACVADRLVVAHVSTPEDARVLTDRLRSLQPESSSPSDLLAQALVGVDADLVVLGDDDCSIQSAGVGWVLLSSAGRTRLARPGRPGRRRLDVATSAVAHVALVDALADEQSARTIADDRSPRFDAIIARHRTRQGDDAADFQ